MCTFCVGASRAIMMAKSLRERLDDSWNQILGGGKPMTVADLDEESHERLEDAWAKISASAPSVAFDDPNKLLELLASARKEASDLFGLLMAAPGFSCGGVTTSTIVYTRNGRAFHAVIHDVTDQYDGSKAVPR